MGAAKTKRIKFSEEEKLLVLEEFPLRRDILIPGSSTQARQRAWEEIAAAVNALSPAVRRSPAEVRKQRHNTVPDARRELRAEKHPLLRLRPRHRLSRRISVLLGAPGPPPAASPGAAPPPGPAPGGLPEHSASPRPLSPAPARP